MCCKGDPDPLSVVERDKDILRSSILLTLHPVITISKQWDLPGSRCSDRGRFPGKLFTKELAKRTDRVAVTFPHIPHFSCHCCKYIFSLYIRTNNCFIDIDLIYLIFGIKLKRSCVFLNLISFFFFKGRAV